VDYSTPYPVVTVELDEQAGLRYSSTVVEAPDEEIQIGRRVELDWMMRGNAPLPVFRLAGPAPAARGRAEDTFNLMGHTLRKALGVIAVLQGWGHAARYAASAWITC
jgi:DUF35 OB-fold domain, acyl-CoA-associated